MDSIKEALATYRLTKLIIDDEIFSEVRDKIFDLLDSHEDNILARKLSYFLTCPWCVSLHSAAFLLLLKKILPDFHNALTTALSYSAVSGIIDSRL